MQRVLAKHHGEVPQSIDNLYVFLHPGIMNSLIPVKDYSQMKLNPNLPFGINLILLNNILTTYKYFDSTPSFQIVQQFKPKHLNASTYIPDLCPQDNTLDSNVIATLHVNS